MSNNIVEENPAQQKSNAPQGQGAGGGQDKVRKQARQLAYDVRYKVKQGFKDGQKSDPASLKSAYISQLGRSPAPGPVKQLAKTMLVGESYDFVDVKENATKSFSNIFSKVFTKTTQIDDVEGKPAYEITDVVQEDSAVRKYKVRVTDKKSGKSYTRMADRAKISELRKNPNISSVEMTGYGSPYEGEKKKGSQTAAVKSGKGLAKKDFDGDGKRETPTAEYKGSKDKAIKKAIKKRSVTSEQSNWRQDLKEIIGEVGITEGKKSKKKKAKNPVCINPDTDDDKNKYEEIDAKKVAESLGAELKGLEIEDADGNLAFEVVDLIKPDPMKGVSSEEVKLPEIKKDTKFIQGVRKGVLPLEKSKVGEKVKSLPGS